MTPGVTALTWWDRLAPDQGAEPVFAAAELAARAGATHRVVGVREDVDGTDGSAGRAARAEARRALATTWGVRVSPSGPDAADAVVPLGDVLDQVLPRTGVLWLGAVPRRPRVLGAPGGAPDARRPATRDLVQGVRPVVLPFSDRLLGLLPEG